MTEGPRLRTVLGVSTSGGLRLLVFDTTCRPKGPGVGLSTAWSVGARLYRARGLVDASMGVRSWAEALSFLASHGGAEPIREIQYWGHGTFGKVWVAKDALDTSRLASPELRVPLDRVRDRLAAAREEGHEPLVWLRTCEAFGGPSGHTFAAALASRLGARVAGHTHVIGVLQSGLVALRPGEAPSWPSSMGLGPRGERGHGLPSLPNEPNTVHFLTSRLPAYLG